MSYVSRDLPRLAIPMPGAGLVNRASQPGTLPQGYLPFARPAPFLMKYPPPPTAPQFLPSRMPQTSAVASAGGIGARQFGAEMQQQQQQQQQQRLDMMNSDPAFAAFAAASNVHRPHGGGSAYKGQPSQMLPIRVIGDVVLKDCRHKRFVGSGGSIHFFLLGKQIKHSFSEMDRASWEAEKHSLELSHVLPSVELPLLSHNGIMFHGTAAVLRYLTKKMGEYGSDVRKDYIADVVTDKLHNWRNSVTEAMNTVGLMIPDGVYGYVSKRNNYFDEFENMLECYIEGGEDPSASFFTGSNAVMCDYYLFAILYDDKLLMQNVDLDPQTEGFDALAGKPRLQNLYNKIESHPQIAEYIRQEEAAAKPPVEEIPQQHSQLQEDQASAAAEENFRGNAAMFQDFSEQQQQQQQQQYLQPAQQPLFDQLFHRPPPGTGSASYEPPPQFYPPIQSHSQQQQQLPPFLLPPHLSPDPVSSYSYTPLPVAVPPPANGMYPLSQSPMAGHGSVPPPPTVLPGKILHRLPPPGQEGSSAQIPAGPWGGAPLQGHPLRPLPHFLQQPSCHQSYFPHGAPPPPPPQGYPQSGVVPFFPPANFLPSAGNSSTPPPPHFMAGQDFPRESPQHHSANESPLGVDGTPNSEDPRSSGDECLNEYH